MNNIELQLTAEERDYLVNLLSSNLTEKHAEVRRTEFSSQLHDRLRSEEVLVRNLLEKLRQPAAV